jgi:hypothetical protein
MNFQEFSIKLRGITDYSQEFCLSIIKQDDEEILDLNRGQLFDGKQADDNDINGAYSRYTEAINQGETFSFNSKSKRKNFNETYFLKDTGEFYDSFRLKVEKDKFIITADTQKDDTNLLIYGANLLGLNKNNLSLLTEDLLKQLYNELNKNYFV